MMCCNMFGVNSSANIKIAPTLSPSKTVEGFVGGVFKRKLIRYATSLDDTINAWQAFLMSMLICLMGFLGGS